MSDVIEGLSKVERQLLKDKVASKATKQTKIDTFFTPKIKRFFKTAGPVVDISDDATATAAADTNNNSTTDATTVPVDVSAAAAADTNNSRDNQHTSGPDFCESKFTESRDRE